MAELKNVLITGASGLIGHRLTSLLQQRGKSVFHLGRARKGPDSFVWDIERKFIEPAALENIDAIIHLAGAGVSDKRWTPKRKEEILRSRTESSRLLFEKLQGSAHHVRAVISASAIGYYGFENDKHVFTEDDPPGKDFLAEVTHAWENEVDRIGELGIRVVKIRIGIVLSKDGGALKQMAAPVKMMVGSPLGSGKQPVSWIHIDDLCEIFIRALDDKTFHGPYNGVAPNPVTNAALTKAIAQTLHRPLWAPAVPTFILKTLLGEMGEMVVKGSNVSARKLELAGFNFHFPDINKALQDLLGKHQ